MFALCTISKKQILYTGFEYCKDVYLEVLVLPSIVMQFMESHSFICKTDVESLQLLSKEPGRRLSILNIMLN